MPAFMDALLSQHTYTMSRPYYDAERGSRRTQTDVTSADMETQWGFNLSPLLMAAKASAFFRTPRMASPGKGQSLA